jgi:tetratricopeptide (TPR) repeat protein
MPAPDPVPDLPDSPPRCSPRRANALAAALIIVAAFIVYARSFSGPFVFDDLAAIQDGNPSIHRLWPLGPVLSPPSTGGQTVGGRPVLNLSLALNYALSGTAVASYHVVNLLIHVGAALALFGIVRRTFLRVSVRARDPDGPFNAALFAGAAALLWELHPLQTEAVTYVIQRAESLMGLFYLLTLYGFVRATERDASAAPAAGRGGWWALSIFSCLLGMGTKETMATAPVMVLIYDWTFGGTSVRAIWRERRWYYAALAATWIPLGFLVAGAQGRGETAGFGGHLSAVHNLRLQVSAVTHYLRLAVWPRGQVFDYGAAAAPGPHEIIAALLLLALGGATVLALRRRSPFGFLGAWFFVLLAPSSSVVPIEVQPVAEHRMYLPLAALVISAAALGAWTLGKKALLMLIPAAVALGAVTAERNETYRTPLALWSDTVAKMPQNARAQCNLADALLAAGRGPEALSGYAESLRLELPRAHGPGHTVISDILTNYGNALLAAGRPAEAQARYEQALTFDPDAVKAEYNLGTVLMQEGELSAAAERFSRVLVHNPDYAPAHSNLGAVLLRRGQLTEALEQYRANLALRPDSPTACFNYGNALLQAGRAPEAAQYFSAALKLQPDFAAARDYLARAQSGSPGPLRP